MGKFNNLVGQRFGRLTVKGLAGKQNNKYTWECLCECGNKKTVTGNNLRTGRSLSCGCLQKERASGAKKNHHLRNHDIYKIWAAMRSRCNLPSGSCYKNYGGRGIKVCPEWDSFPQFLKDMGPRPSKEYTLDRINNSKGYSPENCRWATRATQNRNTRSTIKITHPVTGITMCARDWAKVLGGGQALVSDRIRVLGWTPERAIITPARSLTRSI